MPSLKHHVPLGGGYPPLGSRHCSWRHWRHHATTAVQLWHRVWVAMMRMEMLLLLPSQGFGKMTGLLRMPTLRLPMVLVLMMRQGRLIGLQPMLLLEILSFVGS